MPIDSTQVISTIVYENPLWLNSLYVFLGALGVLLRIMVKVAKERKGKTLKDFWIYVKDDSLIVTIAYFSYFLAIALWWSVGIDFMGLYKGSLTAMTIFVGVGAERILATAMKEKGISVEEDQKEKPNA